LAAIRSAYPKAQVFVVVTPNIDSMGTANSYAAAIATMVSTIADPAMYCLNYNSGLLSAIGGIDYSDDVAHPNIGGATKIASQLAHDIQVQLAASGFKPQVAAAVSGGQLSRRGGR
jgi:lysophospholipase L1-like esterase